MKVFSLKNKVAVITGGGGLLGKEHAWAIAQAGGIPVLWDIRKEAAIKTAQEISRRFAVDAVGMNVDVTKTQSVRKAFAQLMRKYKRMDILINNAARDPKVNAKGKLPASRFENFSIKQWNDDIAVGLTGALICSQVLGEYFSRQKQGVILNISSDLGIIAPDQRIYEKKKMAKHGQAVKPVSYGVVKHGIIGLTKYLATYWARQNVRVNALCPGGVYTNQPAEFVKKLTSLIPMGRMATSDEYQGAVVFLVSDASSYMTGTTLVVDGGRTCW